MSWILQEIGKEHSTKDAKTGPGFNIESFVLYGIGLSKIPFKDFSDKYSQYKKADKMAQKAMKQSKLRSEWEKADGWKKQIVSDKFLIDEIPKKFATCYATSTPGKSVLLFVDLVQTCLNT
jgi:hypothetical protein